MCNHKRVSEYAREEVDRRAKKSLTALGLCVSDTQMRTHFDDVASV